MKLTEKMSYLKGYIDGLEMDKTSKEWKVIDKMTDLMDEMVAHIDDLQNQVDELSELCDNLDEDLGEVEEEVFGFNLDDSENDNLEDDFKDDEDDFDNSQLYEAVCPTCGRTILLTEDMLDEGGIECECGESLEFDFEGIDDEEETTSIDDALDKELLEDLSNLEDGEE
ncbi:MAG: CD1247 N-terminal domain-containing protein [Oscillospiraceae bacterium]